MKLLVWIRKFINPNSGNTAYYLILGENYSILKNDN